MAAVAAPAYGVADPEPAGPVPSPPHNHTWPPGCLGSVLVHFGARLCDRRGCVGLEDGDASCAIVLDHESGEQVAELHGRVPPERLAHLLHALAWHYRKAVLAVERNNHGHSVLNTLRKVLRYPLLYHHVRYDHRTGNQITLGWPTDQSTKPILVDDLAAAIAGGHVIIHSQALIDECMTFITTDTGSQEAQAGKYDDRVMALGIAWQVRKRPLSRGSTQRPEGW